MLDKPHNGALQNQFSKAAPLSGTLAALRPLAVERLIAYIRSAEAASSCRVERQFVRKIAAFLKYLREFERLLAATMMWYCQATAILMTRRWVGTAFAHQRRLLTLPLSACHQELRVHLRFIGVISAILLSTACYCLADDVREAPAGGDAENAAVNRGRYLVHHVAMCVRCHSPRAPSGKLIPERILMGGTIPVAQPYERMPWALKAPRLAGLPGWEEDTIVQLLVTGKRPDQTSPRPPMPPFRLKPEDAKAIVAYLASLR